MKSGKNVQATVSSSGKYTLNTNPNKKGTWQYRVTSGSVHSLPVTVTVT